MSPLRTAWRDYREAAGLFSRPARLYLVSTLLGWAGFGINQVLFNLYLVEGGFKEAFVGRTISLNGLGLALAALPAGVLADRWGRRRCLVLGGILDAIALAVRAAVMEPSVIYAATFCAGAAQSMIAIAGTPFLSEHSTTRERTHLFSAFFATELMAGVAGSLVGGWLPNLLRAMPAGLAPGTFHAYRATLLVAALLEAVSAWPLLALRGLREPVIDQAREAIPRDEMRKLRPIALNALLIGAGAGLVIPFMNLYFKSRFGCSSAQIGVFFSIAQVLTAFAALVGPALAGRFGKLRTAVGSQLLSLPFLVTLGAEQRLAVAVAAFWMRATLMQASTPLMNAFIMEALPPALRARSTSVANTVWNLGWAISATLSGALIQRFGYHVPFYVTAALYATAALTFYSAFRHEREPHEAPRLSEEAKRTRGEGPGTE